MKKRKPILLIDHNKESRQIKNMLFSNNIDFIEYNIKSLEEIVVGIFLLPALLAFVHLKGYIGEKMK
jgi:hypothetical protein